MAIRTGSGSTGVIPPMRRKQPIALMAGIALLSIASCLYMAVRDEAGHEPVPERALGDPPSQVASASPDNPRSPSELREVANFEPAKPAPQGADWMRPATSVELDRVRATGREWIYGWLEAPVPSDAAVVGTAGRFARARLPADASILAEMGAGFVDPDRKLRMLDPAGGKAQVFVTLMDHDPDGRWAESMAALGADLGRYDPDLRAYLAGVTWPVAVALAAEDFVLDVRPVGTVTAAHDTLVPALGADALRTWNPNTGQYSGTVGASVPLGVLDTGLNIAHEDIATGRDTICGANFIPWEEVWAAADLWIDEYGHGTHVTGTIAGAGSWARRYTGVAPLVRRIRIGKVITAVAGSHDTVNRGIDYMAGDDGCGDGATGNKPLVVNMSLSTNFSNDHDGRGPGERKVDAAVWNHRQLYVVAQANDGLTRYADYSAAKNSLAVGAAADSGDIAYFSSLGPTVDGRLSPNLVGVGVAVNSAEGNGSRTGYVRWNGTSMAAPAVAGIAVLLMDAHDEYRENPALVRAKLMASAVRPDAWLVEAGSFPLDNTGGPGEVQRAYGMGKASARLAVTQRDGTDGWIGGGVSAEPGNGESVSQEIDVPVGVSRLELVLTWDEPPAEAVADAVFNDLDLWLDEGGDCGGGACGEYSSMSVIDNVEWIIVRNPPAGTYEAKIVAERVHGDKPRAGLAWNVVRGPSTPTLTVAADRGAADQISVDVTVDGYVAAGVRLHIDCRGDGCADIGFDSMAVTREDGTAVDLTEDMSCVSESSECYADAIEFGGSLPLGEVAAGETQTVTLGVDVPSGADAVLRFTASGWNAAPGHDSVAFNGGHAVPEVPHNDSFDMAEEVSGESGSRSVDLLAATVEQGEPPLVYRLGGPRNVRQRNTREWYDYHLGRPAGSVWFSWTAPAGGLFRFVVSPGSDLGGRRYDRVDVYTGDSLATLARKASGDGAAVVMARRGTVYRVRVANFLRGAELELNWSRHQGAVNNYFASAVRLSGESGAEEGTSVGANTETAELLPLAATTWFRWRAPSSGDWRFRVEALDDTPSPVTALFAGTSIDSLRLVSGYPGGTAAARLEGGTEYRVVVAERSAYTATGRYRLSWEKAELPDGGGNDFLAGATEIRTSALLTQPSVEIDSAATVESGEPGETGVRTKWWHWTAAADGVHTMHVAHDPARSGGPGSGTATQSVRVSVFSGDGLADLVHLGGTLTGGNPEVQWDARNGVKYHISMGMPPQAEQVVTQSAVYGLLTIGKAPANDTEDAATELTGMSGGRRGVRASNRHAGSEPPAVAAEIGGSTVWWTWTAEESGWMEFSARNGPWIIAVHVEGIVTASSRWQRTEGAGTDPASVLFDAVEGRTYTLSVGVPRSRTGGTITLTWDRAEPPAWLTVAGQLVDGSGTEIRGPGSMVVHASGTPLYLASSIGLQVFDRDLATGGLEMAQALDAEADALLLHDAADNRLLVEKCGDWAEHDETDDGLGQGAVLAVADDPGRCGNWLLMHGSSIYRASDGHIDLFDVGEDGAVAYSATTEIADLVQAAVAPSGGHVYVLADNKLLTYARAEDGTLAKLEEAEPNLYLAAQSLSIAEDGSLLFVAVADSLDYGTVVYDLQTPADPRRIGESYPYGRKAVADDRQCRLTAARLSPSGSDVVCRDLAFAFRWDAGAEESVDGGKLIDQLFSGDPDRHNEVLPEFGTPVAAAASPDGRHLYVSTQTQGILIFGRPVGTPDGEQESQ